MDYISLRLNLRQLKPTMLLKLPATTNILMQFMGLKCHVNKLKGIHY